MPIVTNVPHWPHYGALSALKMTSKRSRQMPSIMKLISLSALCIHARCSGPNARIALCSGARNTRLGDEARSVTHPSLCSSLSCHSYDCINRLSTMYCCLTYFQCPLAMAFSNLCHVHISLPCFLTSSKSLCVIQRISKHIWKCVKIIWGQPCNMILNFNTHFNLVKTQTKVNVQVSEKKKNLTERYSFGTPCKSSSQDNCSQKFKCQILWSIIFLHNTILDTCCSYVIRLKVFSFSFCNDYSSTLRGTSLLISPYIPISFCPVFL